MRVHAFRRFNFKPIALVDRLCKVLSQWWPALSGPVRIPRPLYAMQAMEPRMLLSADLGYVTHDTAPMWDPTGIATYVMSRASTHSTDKAQSDSGSRYWRPHGAANDLAPVPATKVLEIAIDDAVDLDVNVKRSNLGVTAVDGSSSLDLSDFIGDTLTIDRDSLNAPDGPFDGTTIDVDAADGHDLGTGSSSDSVDGSNVGGVQATFTSGLFEVVSDAAITVDAGSIIAAGDLPLSAVVPGTSTRQQLFFLDTDGALDVDRKSVV